MSTDENVALVKGVMEALMAGDPAPLFSSISDDFKICAAIPDGTPISGEFAGRDGLLRYLGALNDVMEILEMKITDYTASAHHVVLLGRERARVRRTGKLLDSETATVVGVANGKINKLIALADMSTIIDAYRAIGLQT